MIGRVVGRSRGAPALLRLQGVIGRYGAAIAFVTFYKSSRFPGTPTVCLYTSTRQCVVDLSASSALITGHHSTV